MRIQVEKFLAVTAMLASAAVIAGGCSSEDTTTNNKVTGGGGSGAKGGTGGKDGSAGGTGGATGGTAGASAGGSAGGGGVAGGAAGGGGTAGSGGTCLGDGDPDAGTEGIDCTALDNTLCGTAKNLGVQFCEYMATNGRADVNAELYTCLAAITGDPCATAAETAVQTCYQNVAQKACQHAPIPDGDGGTYDPCVDLNSDCAAVSVAECNLTLNPLTSTYVETVLTCYVGKSGDCKTDFEDCVNLP